MSTIIAMEAISKMYDTARKIPLRTALRYITEFVELFAFTSRVLYLTALCTIWELPWILIQRYNSIVERIKNLHYTGH